MGSEHLIAFHLSTRFLNDRTRRFLATMAVSILLLGSMSDVLEARTRRGDKLLNQGREAEKRKEWDRALDVYEQALSQDPGAPAYQLAVRRVRFQAGQFHVDQGQKIRTQGRLDEALAEFEKAYAIDPASSIAEQEIRRTRAIIEREKKKAAQPGAEAESSPEERGMTAAELAKKQNEERFGTMLPVPELKPLTQLLPTLKMNNQPPRVLFETVGKLAGVNVLFDPEYQPGKNQSIEIANSTLDQALDYVSVITKSFWKPLSANTIFVTNDTSVKRRDYEEQVTKVFYLKNVTTAQELQEILTAARSIADVQRMFAYNAQTAIIARAEADRIALAEKIISDLDKPKSEVIVDVIVMESSRVRSRDLQAGINGIDSPVIFNPPADIRIPTGSTGGGTSGGTTGGGTTGGTTGGATGGSVPGIPLTSLNKIGRGAYYTVTVPNGRFQALLKDSNTRILQAPQVRAADTAKASLKIGQRVPVASGSFQPGFGGVGMGVSPLVNTQFQYLDVGVNVDITPKIHGTDEVSLHVDVEISNVSDRVDLGGISQPVIGQRKVSHDVRMREGEVNLLGGLMQTQETKSVSGVPLLSSIPLLGRLFSSEILERNQSELLIALIPHVVRAPDISDVNVRGIAVGNASVVKLNYAPRKPASGETPSGVVTPPASAATLPSAAPPATAAAPPTPAAPPAAPAPAAPVRITFAPPQVATPLGAAVTVTVMAENASDMLAVPLQLKFDPKVLRLNDVILGALLVSGGQPPAFTWKSDNDAGEAVINLSRQPGAPGNPSGTLVTLVFQAIARGSTTVGFSQVAPRNAQNAAIPVETGPLTVDVR